MSKIEHEDIWEYILDLNGRILILKQRLEKLERSR